MQPKWSSENDAAVKPQDASAPDPASPKLLQPGTTVIATPARNPFRPGARPASVDAETATLASIAPRWRPLPEEKPFDPLGIQAGAFNLRPAFEFVRGYDTNPARITCGPTRARGSTSTPLRSWSTPIGTGTRSTPTSAASLRATIPIIRWTAPSAIGNMNYRVDVTSLSQINLQGRLIVGTDRPGSPFIQADLSRLPIYTTLGGGVGFDQKFNRFEVIVKGDVDRTKYQDSNFVDGETESNADRNYTQYTGTVRTNYELTPGVIPFAEFSANRRVHDLPIDRFGLERDSDGWSAQAGTSFEFSRKLTGSGGAGISGAGLSRSHLAQDRRPCGQRLFVMDGRCAHKRAPLRADHDQ
jgi:hypothetical protein